MTAFYVYQIRNGKMKLKDVPAKWYKQVAAVFAADKA